MVCWKPDITKYLLTLNYNNWFNVNINFCGTIRLLHDLWKRLPATSHVPLRFTFWLGVYHRFYMQRCRLTSTNKVWMILQHKLNFCTKMCTLSLKKLEFKDLFTFLSAPAVLQACLSSGLNLEESAAKAWMNWRLYSIFTTQVKCSAKRDILKHFSIHRTFIRGTKLFHRNGTGQQLSVR